MKKQLSIVQGEITNVSNPIHIERQQKPSFSKLMVGIKTDDAQVLFIEVRDLFGKLPNVGQLATIQFYFAGSTKGDKSYNNLIAKSITFND